jgi:hypothetical protein
MKFLKGLLISLLSFLLFIAISTLAFAFMLNQTVMDPNFTAAEVDKMDISSIVSSFIQVPDSGTEVNAFIPAATVNAAITSSIKSAEPELKSELRAALFETYDYFFSRSNNLNISISLESVKTNLKTTLRAALEKSPPAQIGGYQYNTLTPTQINDAFNSYFDQSTKTLLAPITIDSNTFDQSTMEMMQEVKQGIAYYQFWWLTIPLIFLIAVAIVLLENNLRSSLRNLGINLFLFGALGIAGDFLLKYFAGPSSVLPGLPAALQVWFVQLLDDVFAPLTTFSIAVAVIGAVLIIGSFFVPKKEAVGA